MAWYDEDRGDGLSRRFGAYAAPTQYDAAQTNVMHSVYRHMAMGLGVTGITALVTSNSREALLFAMQHSFILFGLQLALVFGFSLVVNRVSALAAAGLFYVYALTLGLTLSPIFMVYTHGSIAGTFFVTAGTFGAMSVYGYTTKRDLSSMGSFLFMGLIGIIIASVVNIFLQSTILMWITTYIGVLIFVGLTAYDTNRIKEMAYAAETEEERSKVGIRGALTLYLDFINLFIRLLMIMGRRR